MAGRPSVVFTDETLRDGLQIESVDVSVEQKLQVLEALSEAGLTRIMVGSFVSPKWTPQMARTDELVQRMTPRRGTTYLGLALNERGRERLRALIPPMSLDERPPVLGVHLCDVFIKRNLNRTVEAERAEWPAIIARAAAGEKREASVSLHTVFGSNFRGSFSEERQVAAVAELIGLWGQAGFTVTDIRMNDPMGWSMPHRMAALIGAIRERWPAIVTWRTHLHNQRGMALASQYAAIAALDAGHTLHLDGSLGGIGGCPYCGNGRAAGMAPTEDVLQLLEAMGISTGADLYKVAAASALLEEIIGRPLDGHVSKAGPLPTGERLYGEDLPQLETHHQALHWRLGPSVTAGLPRPWTD